MSEYEEEESDEEKEDDDQMLVEKSITEDDKILAEKTIREEESEIEEKIENNNEKNIYEKNGQVYNINNEEIEQNWANYYSDILSKKNKSNNTETKYITKK